MSLQRDDNKPLKKYKTISTKIEDLKNIELDTLPVCDDRYLKTKIRTYGDEVYTNFCGLNAAENGIECKFFWQLFPLAFHFVSKTIFTGRYV